MPPTTDVIGRRIAAYLIDATLLWAITLGCFALVAHRRPTPLLDSSSPSHLSLTINDDQWYLLGGQAALFVVLALALWLGVVGVLPGVTGWTPGKRLMGIAVVGADGRPPGAGRGIVRSLMWIVDGFPYFLPGLVGFVVVLSTPRRQRVGDQVAKTFVVRAGSMPADQARPLPADAPPASAAAGWYADPRGEQRLRYWDGVNWTDHTAE